MVKISQEGVPVEGSPFTCNVYDVGRILVAGLNKKILLGQSCTFSVDASKAGEGTLELVVTTPKTSVRAEVQAKSRGLYEVTFVPQETYPHFVNITFNDEHIANSPFECAVIENMDAADLMAADDASAALGSAADGEEQLENGFSRLALENNKHYASKRFKGEGASSAIKGKNTFFDLYYDQIDLDNQQARKVAMFDPSGSQIPLEKERLREDVVRYECTSIPFIALCPCRNYVVT